MEDRRRQSNGLSPYRYRLPQGIQGGIWPAPPQSPDFVQLFVAVEDIQAAVDRAQQLGARILIPPTKLPEGDEMAVLHDPQGISFGLWRRR